jgi:hypothetical protein
VKEEGDIGENKRGERRNRRGEKKNRRELSTSNILNVHFLLQLNIQMHPRDTRSHVHICTNCYEKGERGEKGGEREREREWGTRERLSYFKHSKFPNSAAASHVDKSQGQLFSCAYLKNPLLGIEKRKGEREQQKALRRGRKEI